MSCSVEIYPKIALRLHRGLFRNGHCHIDVGVPYLNLVNLLKMVRELLVGGELQARYSNEPLGLIPFNPLIGNGQFNRRHPFDGFISPIFPQNLVGNHRLESQMLDVFLGEDTMFKGKYRHLPGFAKVFREVPGMFSFVGENHFPFCSSIYFFTASSVTAPTEEINLECVHKVGRRRFS